jgi:ankyrin repeat protein
MDATRHVRDIYTGNSAKDHAKVHYGNVIHNYPLCHQSISSSGLDARGVDKPNEQGQTFLGAAIVRCDHDAVQLLLEQGVSANCSGMKDKSCLRLAIEVGHAVIVRTLINAGALVETTSGDLRAAASLGNSEIVQDLLGHSTYAEKWQPDCKDALLDACRCGRVDIALLFLAKAECFEGSSHDSDSTCLGAETDFDGIHANALRIASGGGHDRLVQSMLCRRVRVDICQEGKKAALQKASGKGHLKTVQVLLSKGADVDLRTGQHRNDALQLASARGRADVVAELLRHGANVNAKGGYYGNALQAASSNGHNRVVQILITANAEVNARGGYQPDALHAASSNGHHEVAHTLLSHRAKVNARGGYYGNALQAASIDGHTEVVKVLLAGRANVNATGGYYCTALQAAAVYGHHQIVRILMEWGADVNIQGGEHGNALAAAYQSGCEETILLLEGEEPKGIDNALVLFLPLFTVLPANTNRLDLFMIRSSY